MAKGALLVGQSGGPTPVINATLVGVVREAARQGDVGRVLGLRHGIEGALAEELVDLGGQDAPTLARVAATPAAALGSCRHKLLEEEYGRILEVLRAHDVRYLLLIGGNDSMDTSLRVAGLAKREGYEMAVVGVPKTIDNDLPETDHCPGYGSAARFLALSTIGAGLDLKAMSTFDDVSILEAMGRHTGWLAAASVLGRRSPGGAPHIVCVPERPFDEASFLERVLEVHRDHGHVFCVVAEGLCDARGEFVGAGSHEARTDAFGHRLVTLTAGVAHHLAGRIADALGLQARYSRPGTLQRSWMEASRTDREEAAMVGAAAVRAAVGGRSETMIALERLSEAPYRCGVGEVPLSRVANQERPLPDAWIAEDGMMVTDAFADYAMPLIGDPLPDYAGLLESPVAKMATGRQLPREGG